MDWNHVLELWIANLPAILLALAAVISSLRNNGKIGQVLNATNGLTEKLITKAEQKGEAQGGMDERARADEREAKK